MTDFKLQIEPAERIVFSGKQLGDEYVLVDIKITNPTNERLAYKINSTSHELFRPVPPVGAVKGGQTDVVTLQFFGGRGVPENGKHYFVFSHIKADDEKKKVRECWKEYKGEVEGKKRIFVHFEKEEEETKEMEEDKQKESSDDEDTDDKKKEED